MGEQNSKTEREIEIRNNLIKSLNWDINYHSSKLEVAKEHLKLIISTI